MKTNLCKMTLEELKTAVDECIKATKVYDETRYRLYPMIENVNEVLNRCDYNIGYIQEWSIDSDFVHVRCGRSYRGEWGEEERDFPVEWLAFDVRNKNGTAGPDYEKLRGIVEERKRIAAERQKKIDEMERKRVQKEKEAEERKMYEKLKAKFGGDR